MESHRQLAMDWDSGSIHIPPLSPYICHLSTSPPPGPPWDLAHTTSSPSKHNSHH
jgi:hypothetical protein